MIHVLVNKHKDSKHPALVHFQNVKEMNSYYRDGIPGEIIANRLDLKTAKSKHKDTAEIAMLLDSVDETTLDGIVCKLDEQGRCIVDVTNKAESKPVSA